MSDHPNVQQAIAAVIDQLPPIGKDSFNQQQGFAFRGVDTVVAELKPLLAKHGVIIVPDAIERIYGQRPTRSGGVMHEVNLHVKYRIYGPAGDFVEASAWGEGTDSGDKATNKAMTGAYKYMLFQLFAVADSAADADGTTAEETVRQVPLWESRGYESEAAQTEATERIKAAWSLVPSASEIREEIKQWSVEQGLTAKWPVPAALVEDYLKRLQQDWRIEGQALPLGEEDPF